MSSVETAPTIEHGRLETIRMAAGLTLGSAAIALVETGITPEGSTSSKLVALAGIVAAVQGISAALGRS